MMSSTSSKSKASMSASHNSLALSLMVSDNAILLQDFRTFDRIWNVTTKGRYHHPFQGDFQAVHQREARDLQRGQNAELSHLRILLAAPLYPISIHLAIRGFLALK